ncbi:MAG: carbohydrate-binding protein, partial [Bacteroidales bacterium]|nr:carbohydrate-binding protein [Bacteroidales bacterium]
NLSWLNPAPGYPYSWAEGPVMWKYNDYYYYSFARDVSGGQKVMRSPVITADQASWEMMGDFFNENDPLKSTSLFTSPNHSSAAVMLDDSTSWVIHPLYAKGEWKGQGRQGLLNQVRYNATGKPTADYPVNKAFTAPKLPSGGIPWMVPKSDFFDSTALSPEWSFMGFTPTNTYSLAVRTGWLKLSPRSNYTNLIVKNDGERNYSLITRLDFAAGSADDEAGLIIIRGDETKYVKLYSSLNAAGQQVVVFTFANTRYETPNTAGNNLWLKMVRVNHNISGYFSDNGATWTQIGTPIDISTIDSYSDFSTWAGTRQGLYVNNKAAFFDLYIYRDAYTPILASYPANMSGTFRNSAGNLDGIHHSDWALYAGVEFGHSGYGKVADSIMVSASGLTGGEVEVWLDSIDSGTHLTTCSIEPTNSWTIFKTFSARIDSVTGRHDVYLKFTGSSADQLFQLKWLAFRAKTAPHFVSANTTSDSTIVVKLDKNVMSMEEPSGFTVHLGHTRVDSIAQAIINPNDATEVWLSLHNNFSYTDTITLSYQAGNLFSKDSLELMAFSEKQVNYLCDSTPIEMWYQAGNDPMMQGDSVGVKQGTSLTLSPLPAGLPGNWEWSGVITTGKTQEQMVNTANEGQFNAWVTYTNECGATSRLFMKITVEKDNALNSHQVQTHNPVDLYPNPAKNNITVNISGTPEETCILRLTLVNAKGQIVSTFTPAEAKHTHLMDVSQLDEGLYTLMIVTRQGNTFRKFLKIK